MFWNETPSMVRRAHDGPSWDPSTQTVITRNKLYCSKRLTGRYNSKTQDEHIRLLEKFIHIIKHSGISLSKKKADIMKPQIEFLGIQIDKNGIKMQTHIK